MPTTKPRHVITETEPVARAIRAAARRWPSDKKSSSKLLAHLVEEGHRALVAADDTELARRRAAIQRASGALSGMYGADYLEQLRQDWPE